MGGLGNQLFQYALFRSLQESGKEVSLDLSELKIRNNLYFNQIFTGVKIIEADIKECEFLSDTSCNLISRVRRKIFGRRKTFFSEDLTKRRYQDEIFHLNHAYLWGYWQSEMYFFHIKEKLLEELCFPSNIGERNREIQNKMQLENSVSIHIRRGDYLLEDTKKIYGEVCTEKYYESAINYALKKYANVHFYIFTNDAVWAKDKYRDLNKTVIDWNQGEQDYLDMYLMTQCKHNIIANSSFSWWGAWLNENKDKEVISPKKWFNPSYSNAEHIICKSWTKIGE